MGPIALTLLEWNSVAARVSDEQQLMQSACDLLVRGGWFRGARLGPTTAGEWATAGVVRSFPLRSDGLDFGTLDLTADTDAAFDESTVALLGKWSEGVARSLAGQRTFNPSTSSDPWLRTAIDTVPALLWSTAADGLLDYWNARHLQYTGLGHEESMGWGWTKTIHPDDLDQLVAKWIAGLKAQVACEGEARMRRADGVYRWHLFRGVPFKDEQGQLIKWYGATTDIDDLKRTENELRRSEAFLAKAQRLSSTGSFGWTVATGAITWSDETFRIFGYDPLQTQPTLEHVFARVHPEDLPLAQDIVAQASHGVDNFECELRLVIPNGARKHIHVVAQALGGQHAGEFVGAVMDVTAVKEMRQALTFRDQVMGILGHDLRNPLSAILGIVQLAKLDSDFPESGHRHAAMVEAAAHRMLEMIDTLLDFAQTRFAGKLPIAPGPTDLRELCDLVVGELAASKPQRVIHVDASGDPRGTWDPGRIAQVVSNLVGNALTHGCPDSPVRVSVAGGDGRVTLRVHNNGSAIGPELITSLFEPFRRGSSAGLTCPRGLGLGLHIAKQIVTAHGGTISVESSTSQGTTFCVDLPRQAPVPAAR
jgi:PAS domain S-box-containing protein